MVAVKSKGDDATKWIKYMKNRHLVDNKIYSPLLYTIGGASYPLPDKSRRSLEPSVEKIFEIWDATGIMRHTVLVPIERKYSLPQLVGIYMDVLYEFEKLTGKDNIITIYTYHTHSSHPHLHIFQVSKIPSRLYIKPSQLEALKVLFFKRLDEPVGKNAHVMKIERIIRNTKDTSKILDLEKYKTKIIRRYNMVEKDMWEEIAEMNRYGKKR